MMAAEEMPAPPEQDVPAVRPWEIAERSLLRMVLRDGALLDRALLAPEQMSRESHRLIWQACLHLRRSGRAVTPDQVCVVLSEMMQDAPTRLEQAQGYVGRLYAAAVEPDVDAAVDHAVTVREYAQVRECAVRLDELQRMAAAHDRRVLASVADLAADLAVPNGQGQFRPWSTSLDEAMEEMGAQQEGRVPGAPRTGLPSLDNLQVFQPGQYVILAGRTSQGKSALGLRIALGMAEHGGTALLVSMEMRDRQLAKRALSAHTKIPAHKLRTANLTTEDWTRLQDEAMRQYGWMLYTMDRGRRDLEAVTQVARSLKARGGLALVVVDYIQRLHMAPAKSETRREALNRTSGALKDLAGDLECAVLALAQINREGDTTQTGGRPRVSDLKESGNLEEDADAVMLLSPDLRGKTFTDWRAGDPRSVLLDIAKSRDGAQRDVPLWFFSNRVHFDEAETA